MGRRHRRRGVLICGSLSSCLPYTAVAVIDEVRLLQLQLLKLASFAQVLTPPFFSDSAMTRYTSSSLRGCATDSLLRHGV